MTTKIVVICVILFLIIITFLFGKLENNSQIATITPTPEVITESNFCYRTEPFEMQPEFIRALSIIQQRFLSGTFSSLGTIFASSNFINCLDIQYSDLPPDTLGVFLFSPEMSSPGHLTILVDNSYQARDDLLTAYLLIHEMSHVQIYKTKLITQKDFSCYGDEVTAFVAQYYFMASLNEGEKTSLFTRAYYDDNIEDPNIAAVRESVDLTKVWTKECNSTNIYNDCVAAKIFSYFQNQILSSPYYQNQCGS